MSSAQRNESDTSVGHVSFPTQDFERIDPVQIVIQEPLGIIQGYNPTSRIAYADTLKVALPAFTPGLWMLMFFTLMVFIILFRKWEKRRKTPRTKSCHCLFNRTPSTTMTELEVIFLS